MKAGMATADYAPLYILKPVAENLWLVDGPEIRMAFPLGFEVPFPTRMTVVRLEGGGLFVHSPIALTPELREAVDPLGPIEHLVSSNFLHYAGIPEWKAAYPAAIAWAAPGVKERAASQKIDVSFDRDLGDGPEPDWDRDLDQLIFEGSKVVREVVFFHRSSRTVILTDLIENFEADKLSRGWRVLLKMAGSVHPDGKAPIDMRMTFSGGKVRARASLQQMLDWAPERVILAHGKWYESNGSQELERAFRWLR